MEPVKTIFQAALDMVHDHSTLVGFLGTVATFLPGAVGKGPLPMVGFERALWVFARSVRPVKTHSLRTDAINIIRVRLKTMDPTAFILVVGQKGVGKTVTVNSALAWRPGVIRVTVMPGMTEDVIIDKVLTAITGRERYTSDSKAAAAARVEWFHSLLSPVKVVLSCAERPFDSPRDYAGIAGAARILAADFMFKVIVDASDNSMPRSVLETLRERVLRLDPLDRTTLEGIPEFKALIAGLNSVHLDDDKTVLLGEAVWHVFGGVPQAYLDLDNAWKEEGSNIESLHRITFDVMGKRIGKAQGHISDAADSDPKWAAVFERFRKNDFLPMAGLGVTRPSPDKVLRLVQVERKRGEQFVKGKTFKQVLVPASPTVGFVLRHGLSDPPSPEDLLHILRPPTSEPDVPESKTPEPKVPEPEMK